MLSIPWHTTKYCLPFSHHRLISTEWNFSDLAFIENLIFWWWGDHQRRRGIFSRLCSQVQIALVWVARHCSQLIFLQTFLWGMENESIRLNLWSSMIISQQIVSNKYGCSGIVFRLSSYFGASVDYYFVCHRHLRTIGIRAWVEKIEQ